MDIALLLKAAVMGIVEGLTEFLPISSTGHLILTSSLLGLVGDKVKVFEIAIQTGAMFAVMWEYRERLLRTVTGITHDPAAQRFALNVVIAFVPAVVMALVFGSMIKERLFNPIFVASAFVIGGLIILWAERRHRRHFGERDLEGGRRARVETVDDMTPLDALKVGLVQCAALLPGTSRSGATIIGSMIFGFSRKAATEFSFFLGIPTLIGAGVYSLYKQRSLLSVEDLPMFGVGLLFAFFSALLCIRWLIRYVSTHDFTIFAWYRIVFGGLVILTAWTGWVEWHG
ncbi:undecaprenyl-diphosphate phosphatase [Aquabacterium sp. A7-Y]|uniref:undecaprenyl-diphosphate phosphatase n=1 Tax=Aquabacterium sp. A7-Y TaxID=1349605 RepID=UPI00223CB7F4|nr:undecaprenyl-diphosphate phosphatase [Aquabacterium sp. A7-Y]MCW7538254.1 undecaprenyl-diphosphate phosphatase [Aquabacterium sp. A7-Y]